MKPTIMEVHRMSEKVGASIVEIITESLYDKPIVVFREYVQNSADSLEAAEKSDFANELAINIWYSGNALYFLDNGTGIAHDQFVSKMGDIAYSSKKRDKNIGYKGIGRLSGLSYCRQLTFINILDFKNQRFQKYTIDCSKYYQLRKTDALKTMQFDSLMKQIATFDDSPKISEILDILSPQVSMFKNRNTGFLVILDDLSAVLSGAIHEKGFFSELSWLLPVSFKDELLSPWEDDSKHELFAALNNASDEALSTPAKAFKIFYNGDIIQRPIDRDSIRRYLCRSNLEQYAVCIHTFSNTGIAIDNTNSFSGIRLYVDNVLLCDEAELIPALKKFDLLLHSVNETIQTVRGIGAIIYIIDKDNIYANARRTFIEVTDEEAFNFLKLIGEFVENVYQARYALSGYYSAQKKEEITRESLNVLKEKAQDALLKLASQEIKLEDVPIQVNEFSRLPPAEQRKIIKSKISRNLNIRIKRYLEQATVFDPENCFDDFITWLKAN